MGKTRRYNLDPIKERKPLPSRSGEYHTDRKKQANKAQGRVQPMGGEWCERCYEDLDDCTCDGRTPVEQPHDLYGWGK